VTVEEFGDVSTDSAFLNELQSTVNTWIKEIHKVSKLTRDAGSGTASQEVNFWLGLERELDRIDTQLKSDSVSMFLSTIPDYICFNI
jgi:dynein heavy chain 1